jgi:hypothetical protein
MLVTVDPTSSGITTTEQGGSFTVYSGHFAWASGIWASNLRRAYSDISSKILKANTIPGFLGKS